MGLQAPRHSADRARLNCLPEWIMGAKTHQKRAKLSARVPGSVVGHRWAMIEISPHHNPHFAAHASVTRPGPKNTDIEDSFTSWQCSSPHDQGYISSHDPLPPTPSSRFPVLPSPIPIQPNTAPLSIPNSRAPARPSTTPTTARTHASPAAPEQHRTFHRLIGIAFRLGRASDKSGRSFAAVAHRSVAR